MTALSDNFNAIPLGGAAQQLVAKFVVLASEICYAGGIAAIDYAGEIQAASDTVGLRVMGFFPLKVDNTSDGESAEVKRGVVRFNNSSSSPITRGMIGRPCYVEDDNTVAGKTTNYVPAGLVHDVDSDGVWVDMSAQALAEAVDKGVKVVVAKTDDYTITAAQAFARNLVFTGDKSSAMTFTLPSAVGGMRVGIQRLSATAAHDVSIQAATGDKVLGSAASKKVDNTVDAQSGILYIEANDATDWVNAWPPVDLASWVINNA